MHLHQNPNFEDLMNLITTYDYQFRRVRKLNVYWALPYSPNFVLYNDRQARFLGQSQLSWIQEKEARLDREKYQEHVDALAQKLNDNEIHYIRLERSRFDDLRAAKGSDGVHLGQEALRNMKYWVMDMCADTTPTPLPKRVDQVKTLKARKQMKTHHRRNQLRSKVKIAVAQEMAKLGTAQAGNIKGPKPRRHGPDAGGAAKLDKFQAGSSRESAKPPRAGAVAEEVAKLDHLEAGSSKEEAKPRRAGFRVIKSVIRRAETPK